ncbi:nucleotidyltransferase domain-containing protein [Umezawaea sp. Da 62-37]|uniref:nucleotidyltransferase domain-containing protein n=1 Tax=Umezawaea sp. Da 62-37 TaxID=3075927 RepID=UPI0028F71AB2|nr:hypothetical protein [Umezawaea sp. Da 62-37]WNV87018.1 hypothetical protein RM788_01630 [Umezawaea sp. Da 62-37]
MNDGTRAQFELIREFTTALARGGQRAWLFGGWGLDARIGRVTRDHGDVEFWVDRATAHDVLPLVVGTGAVLLDTRPPEESAEYDRDGVRFSTAYFDARADGTFAPRGRFDDWVFPAGSFPGEPVDLAGLPVRAMSAAGMLTMKEQFPHLRGGRPWRDKDVVDVGLLRSMLGGR